MLFILLDMFVLDVFFLNIRLIWVLPCLDFFIRKKEVPEFQKKQIF